MIKKLFLVLVVCLISCVAQSKQQPWPSISYDMVISRDGVPKTAYKVYLKDNNWRVETIEHDDQDNTRKVITIIDSKKDIMYMYYPEENTAMKMKLDPTKSPAPALPKPKGKKIGSEKVDSKLCDIYEYTEKDYGIKIKIWICREKGLPIKMEGGGTTTEYKNYSFTPIPDSIFILPKGVNVSEMNFK